MNGYDLARGWYDFAYKNKRKVKPIHHAIIHWIFECHNRSDQDEEFQLSTKEACEILGIANKDTYQIAFKELVEFGAVRMIQEAQGLYVARWISLNQCEIYLPKKQVSTEVGIMVGKEVGTVVDPVVVTVPIYKPKETKETNKTISIDFQVFWDLYDKKLDRANCEKKWKKLSDTERQAIILDIPKYKASILDQQFLKYPFTYLTGRCWEDERVSERPLTQLSTISKNSFV